MNILKHFRGSILLETLLAIVILGLIVTGSFCSYSFVYERILSQRRQRQALTLLQGFMEEARESPYLLEHNAEDLLREGFKEQIKDLFDFDDQDIDPDIKIIPNNVERNGMTTITIDINLNGLPIRLYTEVNR